METILLLILCLLLTPAVGQSGGAAQACPFAHFRTNSNTCLECPLWCSGCQSFQTPCAGCSEGFRLTNDRNQCQTCPIGQRTCGSAGITCFPFYTPLNGQCRPICRVANCLECSSIISASCLTCQSGFALSSNNLSCIESA